MEYQSVGKRWITGATIHHQGEAYHHTSNGMILARSEVRQTRLLLPASASAPPKDPAVSASITVWAMTTELKVPLDTQ